ncbi:MAG: hypothetical protein ACLFQ5_04780 [Oceanicaulis sp.]
MKNLLALIGFLAVLAGGAYLYAANEGGGDPCRARANMFADQIPPALDLLSARYPLRIGLIRTFLNDEGRLDGLVRDEAAARIHGIEEDEATNPVECAYGYYAIYLFRDQVREEIALTVERELGLAR